MLFHVLAGIAHMYWQVGSVYFGACVTALPRLIRSSIITHGGEHKSYNDEKSLALMRVLLTGNAALWLESLDLGPAPMNAEGDEAETESNFEKVKKAFEQRYKTPEIMRFRSAKEIFCRRQKEEESSDDFVSAMRKLVHNIQADEKLTILAILNGLKPSISSYVTQ